MRLAMQGHRPTPALAEAAGFKLGRRQSRNTEKLSATFAIVEYRGDWKWHVEQLELWQRLVSAKQADITSTGFELTPVAIAAGRRLADRLFLGEDRARIAYEMIATVVFSHPPIGCIGLTEPQAKAEFGEENVRVKQSRFNSMLYAFNDDDKKVKTGLKLVLKLPEEKVVGLHCIGPYSDEMMQGFAVAVRMGATRADFEAFFLGRSLAWAWMDEGKIRGQRGNPSHHCRGVRDLRGLGTGQERREGQGAIATVHPIRLIGLFGAGQLGCGFFAPWPTREARQLGMAPSSALQTCGKMGLEDSVDFRM
eukprot:s90_g42.t1